MKADPKYQRWDELVTKFALGGGSQEEYAELQRIDSECREAGLLPKVEGTK